MTLSLDLDADIVELAPWVPPLASAPLRETSFRANAWLPAEDEMLRAMFAGDAPIAAIAEAVGRRFQATRHRVWELGLRRNSRLPWSPLEDAELARRYGAEACATIAGDLGRGVPAVYARAWALGLAREGYPDWTGWEEAQLREGYARGVPVAQLATMLGRRPGGIFHRAGILGLRHPAKPPDWADDECARMLELAEAGTLYSRIRRQLIAEGFPPRSKQGFGAKLAKLGYGRGWSRPWTDDEDELIRRAYAASASLTPLVAGLGRTRTAICWRAKKLGLAGTHERTAGFRQGPVWSDEHNARLRQAYGTVPMQQLVAELGRPLRAIYVHAHGLGLSSGYNRRFTVEEDRRLREVIAAGLPLSDLCRLLDRNTDALQRRAKRLGVAPAPAHTPALGET